MKYSNNNEQQNILSLFNTKDPINMEIAEETAIATGNGVWFSNWIDNLIYELYNFLKKGYTGFISDFYSDDVNLHFGEIKEFHIKNDFHIRLFLLNIILSGRIELARLYDQLFVYRTYKSVNFNTNLDINLAKKIGIYHGFSNTIYQTFQKEIKEQFNIITDY